MFALRYLALNDAWTAMASNAFLSAEYASVADPQRKRAPTNQMVAPQVPENTGGAAFAAPPLLITRSQVRVLPGEPNSEDFRDTLTNSTGSCADACAEFPKMGFRGGLVDS